jgi:hypothetical protein
MFEKWVLKKKKKKSYTPLWQNQIIEEKHVWMWTPNSKRYFIVLVDRQLYIYMSMHMN